MSRRPAPRISAREAWTEIAMAADPALAGRLRRRRDEPDLDDAETAACVAALERSGIATRVLYLALRLSDPRKPREGPGRRGAPARDVLRSRLRDLHGLVRERLPAGTERRAARIVALLVLVHSLDQHGAWWGANGRTPPTGRRRVRWISERVRDLVDEGEGQYGERAANRPRAAATAVGVSP